MSAMIFIYDVCWNGSSTQLKISKASDISSSTFLPF